MKYTSKRKKYGYPKPSALESEANRILRAAGLQWNGAKKKDKSVRLFLGQGRN